MVNKKPVLVECPRDAMQGITEFIPTETKIKYLNLLLKCGFDTLDFGSFVSPKAIPQLADTKEVLKQLDLSSTSTKLLAIVANERGAEEAASYAQIKFLGYPFSISETFQKRNTNASIKESLQRVLEIDRICTQNQKELVIYISMAFGNPYGDEWNSEVAIRWCSELTEKTNVKILALSDTTGVSNPQNIDYLFTSLIPKLPQIEFGAHLHTTPTSWKEKVEAAWNAGCYRFDGAIKGYGGCPMASDALTGNMPMENLLSFFKEKNIKDGVLIEPFQEAFNFSSHVFPIH